MDIRLILFGMCFVLAGLFLWAKFYAPKEKETSLAEARYFESVQNFLKSPTAESYLTCETAAHNYLQNSKINLSLEDLLKRDQVSAIYKMVDVRP